MNKISLILLLSISSLSFNALAHTARNEHQCYWMENLSGGYEWVPTVTVLGSLTKEECYAMDSCDGGLGYSNGGCYKWAQSAKGPHEAWDIPSKN